jgi:hypothetical protein
MKDDVENRVPRNGATRLHSLRNVVANIVSKTTKIKLCQLSEGYFVEALFSLKWVKSALIVVDSLKVYRDSLYITSSNIYVVF